MYTLRNGILVSRPVVLRDNDTAARREADEETDKEIDQLSRRAADRGERGVGADKVAHNNGIDRIVELLKKGTEQDGKEKEHKLRGDRPCRNGRCLTFGLHGDLLLK